MNNIGLYESSYKELGDNSNDIKLFKIGTMDVYIVGHSAIDAVCRSFDLNHWEQTSNIDVCTIAKNAEIKNYRFNQLFLNAVKDFSIPLKLEIKINKINFKKFESKIESEIFKFDGLLDCFSISLIISYSYCSELDLQEQLRNILNNGLQYQNELIKVL